MRARARPARTLCPLRRNARRQRAQSAPVCASEVAVSPSAGSAAGSVGVFSELDESACERFKR